MKKYNRLWDEIEFRCLSVNRKSPKYRTNGMVEYKEEDGKTVVIVEAEKIEEVGGG